MHWLTNSIEKLGCVAILKYNRYFDEKISLNSILCIISQWELIWMYSCLQSSNDGEERRKNSSYHFFPDNLVFKIMGKFQSNGQNRVRHLGYVMLWQIVICNMQYFRISGFVYIKRPKCHLLNKLSIWDMIARKVWKSQF